MPQRKLFSPRKRRDPATESLFQGRRDGQSESIGVPTGDDLDTNGHAVVSGQTHRHGGRRDAEDVEDSGVGEVEQHQQRLVVERSRQWMRRVQEDSVVSQQAFQVLPERVADRSEFRVLGRAVADLLADGEEQRRKCVPGAANQPQSQLDARADWTVRRPVSQ